jgi:hypothetical protein
MIPWRQGSRPPASDGASAESSSRKARAQTVAVMSEDKQVERFFALLANIRALRNVYGAAISGSGCRGRRRSHHRGGRRSGWRHRHADLTWNKVSAGARSPGWAPIVFRRAPSMEPPFQASWLELLF